MERGRIKPITLTDTNTNKVYTLEFNRATIKEAENNGFDITSAGKKPVTAFSILWRYAFKMHHPEVTAEQAEQMLEEIGEISVALTERLFALYQAGADNLHVENPTVAVTL